MTRQRMVACAVAAGMVLLAACAGESNEASEDAAGGTLRIATAETDAQAMEAQSAAGKRYEEETGIAVQFEAIPLAEIYTSVRAAEGTRSAYDAIVSGFVGHAALFQEDDQIVPLDDIVEALGGAEDFFGGDPLHPIDGQVWWVPYDYNPAFGYLRQDWLDELGLGVPTTWEETVEVARAFAERSPNGSGVMMPLRADDSSNWITSQVLWANGVRIFDDEWNVILDSPAMLAKTVESLEFLAELYEYMPESATNASYAETIEAFVSGQVGMSFYSGRLIDSMIRSDEDAAKNVVAFGLPTRDGTGITGGAAYDGFAVFDNDNSEETKKFVQWFFENALLDLYETAPYHFFPTQRSVFESEEWRALPTLDLLWDEVMEVQLEVIESPHMHGIDTDGPGVGVRNAAVFQDLVFPELFQNVLIGNQDPAEAVREAAEQARTLAAGRS